MLEFATNFGSFVELSNRSTTSGKYNGVRLGLSLYGKDLCYVLDCIKHSSCFNSQISHSTVFVVLAQVVKGKGGPIRSTSWVPILLMKETVLMCMLFICRNTFEII